MTKKLKNLFLLLVLTALAGSVAGGGVEIFPGPEGETEGDSAVVPVLVGGLPVGVTVVDGDG